MPSTRKAFCPPLTGHAASIPCHASGTWKRHPNPRCRPHEPSRRARAMHPPLQAHAPWPCAMRHAPCAVRPALQAFPFHGCRPVPCAVSPALQALLPHALCAPSLPVSRAIAQFPAHCAMLLVPCALRCGPALQAFALHGPAPLRIVLQAAHARACACALETHEGPGDFSPGPFA